MTSKISDTYILLGCGIIKEMGYRINSLVNECKDRDNFIVLITGTIKEIHFLYKQVSKRLPKAIIVCESMSRDTIDNIINSFHILTKPMDKIIYDKDGKWSTEEIVDYGKIHIISSDYHINRIKCIVSFVPITKKFTVNYLWCDTRNQDLLKKRIETEKQIEKNVDAYIKGIMSRVKIASKLRDTV